MPLYSYENGAAVDLEFGGCLGLQYAHFNLKKSHITADATSANVNMPRNSFLPLLTDVRVSLVYRFRSISKQHTEIDYALIDRRYVARLMELDWEASLIYNDSIRAFKDELDLRNQEIALYKQAVESLPEFNKAYTLEYLTPYMYMMEAPQRYTRYNKDTLPKIHIDSIEQIVDPILLSVREELDSIPHVTSAQIDKEFVNQYNNISDADGKLVNRTTLIREIYTRLNSYIEDNNSKLVASTFGADAYSEKLNKYNVKQQGRSLVEITYKDSVRTVEMTSNDKIEWLNNIKKQAWADAQRRMRGDYPGRVELPEVYDFLAPDTVRADSVMTDSMLVDSVMLDSMRIDSMMLDSIKLDSMLVGAVWRDSLTSDSLLIDSLVSDSTLVDSLHQVVRVGVDETKAMEKESRRVSKDKGVEKVAKSEKSKKSKKSGKAKQTEELMDSAFIAPVVDGIVAPVALTDSVVNVVIPDSVLQAARPNKVEKTKKAEKKSKSKDAPGTEARAKVDVAADVELVETPEESNKTKKTEKKGKSKNASEAEVAAEVDIAADVERIKAPEESAKTKKTEKKGKSKDASETEVAVEVDIAANVEQIKAPEESDKTKKTEKKGKSKDAPEAEVAAEVDTAADIEQIKAPEKSDKSKKTEKKGKSKDASETEEAAEVDIAADVEQIKAPEKSEKSKKTEKKGKSKDASETEEAAEVDTAADVEKVEAPEISDKTKKDEKAKKSKKSKDEISKDAEVVDSVDVDASAPDSLPVENEN